MGLSEHLIFHSHEPLPGVESHFPSQQCLPTCQSWRPPGEINSCQRRTRENRQTPTNFRFPHPTTSSTTNDLWPILAVSYPEIQADQTENDFFAIPGRDSAGSLETRVFFFFLLAIIEAQMFWFNFVCLFFPRKKKSVISTSTSSLNTPEKKSSAGWCPFERFWAQNGIGFGSRRKYVRNLPSTSPVRRSAGCGCSGARRGTSSPGGRPGARHCPRTSCAGCARTRPVTGLPRARPAPRRTGPSASRSTPRRAPPGGPGCRPVFGGKRRKRRRKHFRLAPFLNQFWIIIFVFIIIITNSIKIQLTFKVKISSASFF